MILVGLLLILGGAAYLVSPWVRQKLDGVKTYLFGALPILGTILDSVDPNLLSVALNLDARWKAGVVILLGVGVVWSRAMVSKPGPLARK